MKHSLISLLVALGMSTLLLPGTAAAAIFVGEVDSGDELPYGAGESFTDAAIYVVRPPAAPRFLAVGGSPRLSPDRRTVAYCHGALMVKPVTGGAPHQIASDPTQGCPMSFEWTPNGRSLITMDSPSTANCYQGTPEPRSWPQISLVNLDGTHRVVVTVGANPVLGDGVLAYVAPVPCTGPATQREGVFVAARDGSNARQIAVRPELSWEIPAATGLVLRPDGRRLAVIDPDGRITIVHTSGAARPQHLGRGFDVAWSPNGKRLAYEDSRGRLLVVAAATGRVIHRLHGHVVGRIAWSGDGSRILFTRASAEGLCPPGPDFQCASVYVVQTRSWTVHRVARGGFLKTYVSREDGSWSDVDWH